MKVLAIGGEPGVGKSTLVRSMIGRLGVGVAETYRELRLTRYETGVCVLGVYAEGDAFGGTDRLSMAVQPSAKAFMFAEACKDSLAQHVIFEGDRLFNQSFLQSCSDILAIELRIAVLYAPPLVLASRRAARETAVGAHQDRTWLAGRVTKIRNICAALPVERWSVDDTTSRTEEVLRWLSVEH